MTDEPITVIEEYLALVNEHLPRSISEDVITELRTYMVETARDLGEGEITLHSAKKVVAQFGAPSEVAKEYKYSMLPETIPSESVVHLDEKQIPKQEGEPQLEVEEPEPRKDPTASPLGAFLQGISIAFVWAILVVLVSTLTGPIWLQPWATLTIVCQFWIVLLGLGALTFLLKRRKTILWKRSYPEWSSIQRFLTLPENVVKEPRDALTVVDILGSLVGIVIFLMSSSFSPTPLYIPLIVFPASATLLAKALYGGKRLSSQDSTSYVKGEFVSTFAALLLIDSSQIWLTSYYYHSSYYLFMAIFMSYSLLWGSVLLFQVVTRSGDLWWDVDDSEPIVSTDETEKLVSRTKNVAGSTILRLIGWIILFTIIPTYCLMVSQTSTTPGFAAGGIAVFLGPVFLSPVIVYYLFRRWRIKSGNSKCIIGERTRFEALGDLAASAYLFIGFVSSSLLMLQPNHPSELYQIVYHDYGYDGLLFFAIGYISVQLLLLLGLGVRIIGNSLEFTNRKIAATESIMVSGRILIFTLSLRVGIDLISSNYILLPFTIYPWVLLLAILIAFQVEISKLKIREREVMMKEESMRGNNVETTGMEIPSNIQKTKKHDSFPGN